MILTAFIYADLVAVILVSIALLSTAIRLVRTKLQPTPAPALKWPSQTLIKTMLELRLPTSDTDAHFTLWNDPAWDSVWPCPTVHVGVPAQQAMEELATACAKLGSHAVAQAGHPAAARERSAG